MANHTPPMVRSLYLFALPVLVSAACQASPDRVPAVLADTEPATLEAVRSVLAGAVGRAQVTLGPEDPATSSTLTTLPPRPTDFETHSLAMPDVFDLVLEDGACLAIHRKSGEPYVLHGVWCRPVD